MSKARKKGMSLAEICVVLAVISIAALMVTSFTVMVGARATVSSARLSTMQDMETTQTLLSNWITRMAIEGAEVDVGAQGELYAQKDGALYTVILEDDALTASLPQGRNVTVPVTVITKLSVEALRSHGDAIYFCTVTYPDPRGGGEELTCVFCINPRVGEKIEKS